MFFCLFVYYYQPRIYENKSGDFVTGLDVTSEVCVHHDSYSLFGSFFHLSFFFVLSVLLSIIWLFVLCLWTWSLSQSCALLLYHIWSCFLFEHILFWWHKILFHCDENVWCWKMCYRRQEKRERRDLGHWVRQNNQSQMLISRTYIAGERLSIISDGCWGRLICCGRKLRASGSWDESWDL